MSSHKTRAVASEPAAAHSGRDLPDHLPRWLEAVNRRMSADLAKEVTKAGQFPQVSGGERRILQMIPAGQIRITDLAAVAGMTKQALGEFVDQLEDAGFVLSSKDPTDGRVRLISRTDHGDAVAIATNRAIAAVEDHWREEIGAVAYDAMMSALRKLGNGFSIG